jgi:hypothetical protein
MIIFAVELAHSRSLSQLIKLFAIIVIVELLVCVTIIAAKLALLQSLSQLNLLVRVTIVAAELAHSSNSRRDRTFRLRSSLRLK